MTIQETHPVRREQSVEETRRVLDAYTSSHDTALLAPDAVFHDVASGQDHLGREAVAGMLHHVYHVALDARAETVRTVVGDGVAVLEAAVVGTHTGEFAGVPATGREVRIPLVASYRIADGLVHEAHVYLLVASFLQQAGALDGGRAS